MLSSPQQTSAKTATETSPVKGNRQEIRKKVRREKRESGLDSRTAPASALEKAGSILGKALSFLSSSGEKEREKGGREWVRGRGRGHGEEAWMATPGAHSPGAISMVLRSRFVLFLTI
jgi:hypothetical protein